MGENPTVTPSPHTSGSTAHGSGSTAHRQNSVVEGAAVVPLSAALPLQYRVDCLLFLNYYRPSGSTARKSGSTACARPAQVTVGFGVTL